MTALFCDETVHRRLSTAHVSTAHVSTADSVALVQTTSAYNGKAGIYEQVVPQMVSCSCSA